MGAREYPINVINQIEEIKKCLYDFLDESPLKNYFHSTLLEENELINIFFNKDSNEYYFSISEHTLLEGKVYYDLDMYPESVFLDELNTYSGLLLEDIIRQLYTWINVIYDLHYNISYRHRSIKIPHTPFSESFAQNIKLINFDFIKEIELKELSNKKEIYILGENGDGKTVLLQALMLAFKEHFVKNIARKSLVGEFLDFDFIEATYQVELEDERILSKIHMSYHSDVYAYGTNRGNILSETEDEYGFMTLFSPRYHLRNPVDWLEDLRGKELELKEQNKEGDTENQNVLTLETAKHLLEDIINSGENPKDIHIEVDLSTKEKVKFIERDTKIKFEHLSEGYRSVFIWVADLVSRLAESQPTVKQIQDFKGIVLVDEIGLHLHPKWENQIVQKLRSWFPNIQFFFTTHSPICVLGASEDAVFYRLYKENGVAQLSEQIEYSQIKEMTANQVVTSMLFDLETPFMRHTDSSEIDTSEDYLYNRIHKKISERLDKRKKEGEIYFSDEEINAMIDEALDNELEED